MWSAEMAAIRGCPERRFTPRRRPQEAAVALAPYRSGQPASGRVLREAAESFAGALLSRAGERTVSRHPCTAFLLEHRGAAAKQPGPRAASFRSRKKEREWWRRSRTLEQAPDWA